MNERDGNLYSCPTKLYKVRTPLVHNIKMYMTVCPHRNAFRTVRNNSDELLSVRDAALVGFVKIGERLWKAANVFNATEQMEDEAPIF